MTTAPERFPKGQDSTTQPLKDLIGNSTDFLVALQGPKQIGDEIDLLESHGLKGRIVEQITHEEYLETWAFRGFQTEARSLHPRYWYRCERLLEVGFDHPPDSEIQERR